jgi:hypothetical protein
MTPPCSASGCTAVAPWLLASKKQRFLHYYCLQHAVELMKTGKFLMLVHTSKESA